ncbi:MAG: hypothetical protein HQM03_17480 [Magnetococcales bacterium]|nr:hypothetical protein [Magnetococcales bacterium]
MVEHQYMAAHSCRIDPPEPIVRRRSLEEVLRSLDLERHLQLWATLLTENPSLVHKLELMLVRELSIETPQPAKRPPAIDPTPFQREAMAITASLRGRYEYGMGATIYDGLLGLVNRIQPLLNEDDGNNALIALRAIMDDRLEKLQERRQSLLDEESGHGGDSNQIKMDLPDVAAHALSKTIERILRSWNFPGDCRVHYDKQRSDFIIDGKARGSCGKGLRAITHAAVTLGLMEYCREQSLPHPGFVIMDSPLLAYFEPEGEDDQALQGTDLKERFYEYLINYHSHGSQVIVIENQHPPDGFKDRLKPTVFTRNPAEGRFGLL